MILTAKTKRRAFLAGSCAGMMVLAACGSASKEDGEHAGLGSVDVGYIAVRPTSVPQTSIYSGRAVAYQKAEVRPQVAGVIVKRLFTEGQTVRSGQPLYQIDPDLYVAAVNQARANQMSALADKAAADELVQRYRPLAEIEAVSKQDLVNAVSAGRRAKAAVSQTTAALETARINQRFTLVPAPLSGRIGRSLVTVGGLATVGQAAPLATIQQLDPIFIDVQQSAAELVKIRDVVHRTDSGFSQTKAVIILPNGTIYPHRGIVKLLETISDEETGTVTMRIQVPNPEGLILPGMFVRASVAQTMQHSVFLVPQKAISRDPAGRAVLWIVSRHDVAVQRVVTTIRTEGANWVVTGGLHDGDRVIIEGVGKLSPNIRVRPAAARVSDRTHVGLAAGQ